MDTQNKLLKKLPAIIDSDTGVRLATSHIYGFTAVGGGIELVKITLRDGKWGGVPKDVQLTKIGARKRMLAFSNANKGFLEIVNKDLAGGDSFPVLKAVLGVATGVVSFGAGLAFTVLTTASEISQSKSPVLARFGDEVWREEKIGKTVSSSFFGKDRQVGVHIARYFLEDPFRRQRNIVPYKWLVVEKRTDLFL